MLTEPPRLRLILRFATKPHLELRATEFHLPNTPGGPVILKCSEGKAGDGFFEWREGTQALCLGLIRFLSTPKLNLSAGMRYVFEGNVESPAKTLVNVIAKANKANCWQLSMFGAYSDGGCRLKRYITRRSRVSSRENRNYEVEFQHDELPQESILFEVDGTGINDLRQLEKLGDDIEDLWYEDHPQHKAEWEKVRAARKTKNAGLGADSSHSAHNSKLTSQASSSAHSPISTLAAKFETLSSASIKSHIIAALLPLRGRDAVEESTSEILSPICINVIAERIIQGSVSEFCDFFYADYDSPPNIKHSIAAVLASNPRLRKQLAVLVAKAGYYDLRGWFQVFSFFCEREIVIELESELIDRQNDPEFRKEFLPYASQLKDISQHFSHWDCVMAVRIFENIRKEGEAENARVERMLDGNRSDESV